MKDALKIIKSALSVVFTILIIFIIVLSVLTFMTKRNNGQIFGLAGYTVLSKSMYPTFDEGSFIISAAVKPEDIKVEDIITFRVDSVTLNTHRVIEINTENNDLQFVTQGDANNVPDPNPVPSSNVLGKTVFAIPYLGTILEDMRNPYFMAVAVIIIIVLSIAPKLLKEE